MPCNISINDFKLFVRSLQQKKVIQLSDIKHVSSGNAYALTIDDVSESFYINGYHTLVEAGIPFTIFVSLELLDKKGYITTKQLIELSKNPLCTVGSHGLTHSYYYTLSNEDLEKELSESRRRLEMIIGKEVSLFAFPFGSYYACGFTPCKSVTHYYIMGFSTIPVPYSSSPLLNDCFLPRISVTTGFIRVFWG